MKSLLPNFRTALVCLTLFQIGSFACLSQAEPPRPALPEKQDFFLFLLAGQSNMAGRGTLDEESKSNNPRVLALNRQNEWQLATDPLHWDKSNAGVGPGKAFGEIIAKENPGITVGLIPTACGGSPIATWVPGGYHDQTKSHPYDDAMARARRAIQDGTLKAILWHQGESDAKPEDAPLYAQRLEELITRFRTELGAPELPVIIGQLGRFPARLWTQDREMVDQAQQEVARKMKNVRFVSSAGLLSRGDNLHFDSASARLLGQRYAEAYLELSAHAKP